MLAVLGAYMTVGEMRVIDSNAEPQTRNPMFVVTLTYACPLEKIDALMPEHVAWLRKHYASGLFIASGRQVPRRGGVILARSGDRQELQALLEDDPFIASGCARAEVVEFTPSMSAPGAEVLKSL